MSKAGFLSLDLMAIDTADLTLSSPRKRAIARKERQQGQGEQPAIKTQIAKDIDITSMGDLSPTNIQKQTKEEIVDNLLVNKESEDDPWWHLGTQQKGHRKLEPIDFSWALKPTKAQGGLNFGLQLSGSTMPFSGRKRLFK
tara:strand:+ start:159 stop:581 length:423 start_codon:yes stop_codon:yes gene_type:complete